MDRQKYSLVKKELSLHEDLVLYKEKHGEDFCKKHRIKTSDLDYVISVIHADRMRRSKGYSGNQK